MREQKKKHFWKCVEGNHNNQRVPTIKKLTSWECIENWPEFVDAFIAIILPTGPFPNIFFWRYTLADHLHLTHYLTKPPESNWTWMLIGPTQKRIAISSNEWNKRHYSRKLNMISISFTVSFCARVLCSVFVCKRCPKQRRLFVQYC